MKLRPKDFNGHVPASATAANPASQTETRRLASLTDEDPIAEAIDAEASPSLDAASLDEQLAETRERFATAQAELMSNVVQIAYELGRLRGIVEERTRQEAAG
jgi:hypothetical protein